MEKIKMTTPLVEMDGDEMTRILWAEIKKELLEPYIVGKVYEEKIGYAPAFYIAEIADGTKQL